MKGFPEHVEGPMGPWYQKVNAAVAKVTRGKTVPQIREILGEPDETIEVPDDDRRQDADSPLILGIRNSYSCIAILTESVLGISSISRTVVSLRSQRRVYAANRAFESGPPSAAAQRER